MGNDSKSDSNVAGGTPQIPAAAKKMVQNLKEIVNKNCTDSEIYAVLLECNMDPDEAVQLLLSQDTFKEVKSKRERRKEMKETQESRAQCNIGTYNRGVIFGTEQVVGRTGSMENNYNELGKNAYKREMGSVAPSVSSSSSYMYRATGKIINEQPSTHSEFSISDNRRQSIGTGDTISSSVPSPALQPTWPGISKRHVSTADIVKGGRPQNKGSQMSNEIPCTTQHALLPNSSHYQNKSPHVFSSPESELHQDPYPSHPSNLSEMIHVSGMPAGQHDFDNEQPVIEHLPASTGSLVMDASAASDAKVYSNHTSLCSDIAEFPRNSQSDDVQVSERDFDSHNLSSDSNESASASHRQNFANSGGGTPCDDLLKETSSYDSHGHLSKHQEGIDDGSDISFPNCSASFNDDIISGLSSAVANLQQLNLGKEEPVMQSTVDYKAVVLPNHLQAFAADCSHLSFGTYKSGVASASPMAVASNPIKSNLEVSAAVGSSTSAVKSNIRNSEYYDHEQRGFMYDTQRLTAGARNYDQSVSSHPELMKQDIPEAAHKHQYIFPLAVPDSSPKNIQQSGSNFPFVVDNARNLPSVPSEMHSESIPTNFLAPPSLNVRDSSPFFSTQSVLSGYSTAVPSINDHTISVAEVLNSGTFSLPQLPSQALPNSNLAKGTVLPQRQPVHSYSQPTLPLGELRNIIGYHSMPQSQAYGPSALQQVYPESSVFRDSLAGMNYNLQQYRSSATVGGLPLSNSSPSAYGRSFGSSSNVPGSFLRNLSTSHTGAVVGYDSVLHSHYKDRNSFTLQQQNNRSSTWDLGVGPQTMSMQSDGAYYSLLGQNPQYAGYQHDQQTSQNNESAKNPTTYHSERITRIPTRRW